VSEVVQIEAIGAELSNLLVRTIAGLVVAVILALPALDGGCAAAEELKRLSGTQIRAKFSDRQLTDEVHWRDVYERDGTFRSYSMGRKRIGKWFVQANDLCLDLPEPDGGCFEVTSAGTRVVITPKGTGLALEGVLQPITDKKK